MDIKDGDIFTLNTEDLIKWKWSLIGYAWCHPDTEVAFFVDLVGSGWRIQVEKVDYVREIFYVVGLAVPIPFSAWGIAEKPCEKIKASVATCSCAMFTLLNHGCKCGCIQKERNRA